MHGEGTALSGYISSSQRSEEEGRDNRRSRRWSVKIQLGIAKLRRGSCKCRRKQYDFVIFKEGIWSAHNQCPSPGTHRIHSGVYCRIIFNLQRKCSGIEFRATRRNKSEDIKFLIIQTPHNQFYIDCIQAVR